MDTARYPVAMGWMDGNSQGQFLYRQQQYEQRRVRTARRRAS